MVTVGDCLGPSGSRVIVFFAFSFWLTLRSTSVTLAGGAVLPAQLKVRAPMFWTFIRPGSSIRDWAFVDQSEASYMEISRYPQKPVSAQISLQKKTDLILRNLTYRRKKWDRRSARAHSLSARRVDADLSVFNPAPEKAYS